jgi:hypothetical protein
MKYAVTIALAAILFTSLGMTPPARAWGPCRAKFGVKAKGLTALFCDTGRDRTGETRARVFSFGDGTREFVEPGGCLKHRYRKPGKYRVVLRYKDSRYGSTNCSHRMTIRIGTHKYSDEK